jgi:alkylation response protein AidB-like acyl-CoA dehydrogenase
MTATGHDSVLRSTRPPAIPGESALRSDVRSFLAATPFTPVCDTWLSGFDPGFSKALADAGFVGMSIPEQYGGQGRTPLERFVVMEELLAAGAPVAAHWIADRQTAPLLLRHGTEEQRVRFLPAIAAGECFFAIGMSEPDTGSDLASIRMTATAAGDGDFVVSGRKIWTSNAQRCHFMVTLCRTSPAGPDRHAGMSQLIVDLSAPGVEIRPVTLLNGRDDFAEVLLDDVRVPGAMLVGEQGQGWKQVLSELVFERSGPERLLSTFLLLAELAHLLGESKGSTAALGRAVAKVAALRQLSLEVAGALHRGEEPSVQAALVKDAGTRHEQHITEVARLAGVHSEKFDRFLAEAVLGGPGFTLRGGTNEILRGLVARGLGLR